MSEPKFTPGPWHVEIVRYVCYICNEVGPHALTFDGSHFGTDSDIANANLIAAAPDMYDMLQSVLDECAICDPNFHYPGDCDLRGQIEAVLKKARGEA